MSPPSTLTKPWKDYSSLVDLLESRGMEVPDKKWAAKKLSQIGYYRLSGFWHICRKIVPSSPPNASSRNLPKREDEFQPGTIFNNVIELYLFDKKLRSLMIDAIERIEIYVRNNISHIIGQQDPMGHENKDFIDPKMLKDFYIEGKKRNKWEEWLETKNKKLSKNREDCIVWHRKKHRQIPIWVAIEAWDFGTMSVYYEIIKNSYQNRISRNFEIKNPKILKGWLKEINTLRNRCAHHTRIWNQKTSNPIQSGGIPFLEEVLKEESCKERLFGLICIIWYMLYKIAPNSTWLNKVIETIELMPTLPSCSFSTMGFPNGLLPQDLKNIVSMKKTHKSA